MADELRPAGRDPGQLRANDVERLPASNAADFSEGEVYFIGNATTLIRFARFTILTDPVFVHKGRHADLGTASTPAAR